VNEGAELNAPPDTTPRSVRRRTAAVDGSSQTTFETLTPPRPVFFAVLSCDFGTTAVVVTRTTFIRRPQLHATIRCFIVWRRQLANHTKSYNLHPTADAPHTLNTHSLVIAKTIIIVSLDTGEGEAIKSH